MNYKKMVMLGVGLFAVASTALPSLMTGTIAMAQSAPNYQTSYNFKDAQTIADSKGNTYYYRTTSQGEALFVSSANNSNCTVANSPIPVISSMQYNSGNSLQGSLFAPYNGSTVIAVKDPGSAIPSGFLSTANSGSNAYGPYLGLFKYPNVAVVSFSPPTGSGDTYCQANAMAVVMGSTQNSTILYDWYNQDTIITTPYLKNTQYVRDGGTQNFYQGGAKGCVPWLQVSNDKKSADYYDSQLNKGDLQLGSGVTPTQKNNCWVGKRETVQLGFLENSTIPASTKPISAISTPGKSATSASTGCTLSNGLGWIVCPIVGAAEEFVRTFDGYMTNELTFDTATVFNKGGGYYAAWNSFRVIATTLLVIGGLVMVAGQAIGFEILDAYTIRKVLPRLLISVIGISLSWPLMEFIISFFNVLGVDIRQLIYSPFGNSLHGTLGGTTLLLANIGLLTAYAFMGMTAILSLGLTAVLALIVGFAIIVVRDLALIVVIILAPIAIASYILPNTQKVWKLWSDNFLGLLMMFPIISAFIAAGRVFSAVSLQGAGTQQPGAKAVAEIVGFVAYFAPYFLLPVAFRMATGAIGAIAGFMNDRGRGAFDGLKKFRGNKIAQNTANMRAGTRFNNRGLNALTSRATTRNLGLGARGRSAYSQKMDLAAMEHAKSAGGMAVQHNDDALRALTYGSAVEARANMKNDWRKSDGSSYTDTEIDAAIGAAKASGGFGRARQVFAAQQLSNTGTGYNSGAVDQVAKTIARASHGNASQIASLAGNINSSTKSAGRHDLAPGFAALHDLSMQEANLGSTHATGGAPTTYANAAENAWNSASLYQHANDKSQNIKAAIDHFTPMLTSSTHGQRQKAAVFFNELRSMQPNASGDVKNAIQGALEGNRSSIDSLYTSGSPMALHDSPLGVADRPTGREEVQVYDPITGNYTKTVTPATGTRPESGRERTERMSRTYERPDPNNI